MKTLHKDLLEAGLKENEAKVYIAILELGEGNIAQITKRSTVNRSTVYLALKTLKEKGLILPVKKNKTLFYAEDPRKMLGDLERKKAVLEKAMPSLLASFAFIDKKPDIKYFEGVNGIKAIYEDVLETPNSEMLSWYSTDYEEFFDKNYFTDYFIPQRKVKKIWVRAIFPGDPASKNWSTNDPQHLRQSRFISKNKFNIESEICLYANKKIGIISYRDKMGVIITSQSIFNTLKSIFEVIWDGATK